MSKYVIEMVDNVSGENPVWFAKFGDSIGITPKRADAFVCDESEIDKYLEIAQNLANKMMIDAYLPVRYARQARKVGTMD